MYANYIKPILDLFTAIIGFLLLSPIFILTMIALAIANNGTPFFVQQRPGKNERIFNIIKFKTMNDNKDAQGNLLPDAQRLTAVGKFVRKISLDELPQLINVLKGDMSLIGPRPLLVKYLPLYNTFQKRRHELKPGITGWAQVNGRNSISWGQKFAYDVYYVDHLSFALDMKILWMTVLKVLKREGVNQSDARPMQPFDGNN